MYRLYEYKSNVQLARKLKPFIARNSLSFTKKQKQKKTCKHKIIEFQH